MIVIGIDHASASPEAIAAAARAADRIAAAAMSAPSADGVVVLATCARVEAYVDARGFHDVRDRVLRALTEAAGELAVATLRGEDAVAHCFAVASGLRSPSVGEPEITGQVRRALERARTRGTATPLLATCFEQAVAASRAARPALRAQRSLAQVAADCLAGAREAVVIGSGEEAARVVAALRSAGTRVTGVSPSGRTVPGADAQAPLAQLPALLADADAVIAASGRGRVLDEDALASIARARTAPLRCIDLTGFTDIAHARIAGIELTGLADLSRADDGAHEAEAITRQRAARAWAGMADAGLGEAITELRALIDQAVAGARTGDPRTDDAIRRVTAALLHETTMRVREAAREGRLDEARRGMRALLGTPEHGLEAATA